MSYIVFDFEAVRDEAVPYEPKPQVERLSQRAQRDTKIEYSYVLEREPIDPFPPACHHRLVCGALLFLGRGVSTQRGAAGEVIARAKILSGSEPEIIAQFMEVVRKRATLVSYSGRNFDVPAVILRGMRYGIDVSDFFSRDYSDRYRGYLHVDLVEHLTNYGATQRPKMVAAARLVGWPGKLGVDGSQVGEMVEEGRMREVERYCLQDTANEAAILLRLELARGNLTRDDYREYAAALLRLVGEHPDLQPLGSHIDRDLFLYCYEPGKSVPSPFVEEEDSEEEEPEESTDMEDPEGGERGVRLASISVEPSGSTKDDLELRNRIGELLLEQGVESDGGDFEIPSGRFSIFLVVPPGEDELVANAVRYVVSSLEIAHRSSYRGPNEAEATPIEEPASTEPCDDCRGVEHHTPDCASQAKAKL